MKYGFVAKQNVDLYRGLDRICVFSNLYSFVPPKLCGADPTTIQRDGEYLDFINVFEWKREVYCRTRN